MTNQEFSDQFDLLYNNITSNQAPGLDEYEKSVFLTTAQEEVIKAYFRPTTNKVQEGYDDSSNRQVDFSNITRNKTYKGTPGENEGQLSNPVYNKYTNSKSIVLPNDILAVINEEATVQIGTTKPKDGVEVPVTRCLQGTPISYTEYTRLMKKPFAAPLKGQCWRLSTFQGQNNRADIIIGPQGDIIQYDIRYIFRPTPIILENLYGVSIDNIFDATPCILDPSIHKTILYRAVELAKAAYMDMNQQGIQVAQQYALGGSATDVNVPTK